MTGKSKLFSNKNIQDSIVIFIIGASLLVYSLVMHRDADIEWKMSPYLFPTLIAIFLCLLSASLFFDGIHQLKNTVSDEAAETTLWKKVLVVIVMVAVYYFAMKPLTFIPSTMLFLAGMIFYLGERKWWLIALISVVSTLVIWGLFSQALGVMLP